MRAPASVTKVSRSATVRLMSVMPRACKVAASPAAKCARLVVRSPTSISRATWPPPVKTGISWALPASPAAPVIALCRPVSPSSMVRLAPGAMATASTRSFSRSLRLLLRWVVPASTFMTMLSCATKVKPSAIRVCACAVVMCSGLASTPATPRSSCTAMLRSAKKPAPAATWS